MDIAAAVVAVAVVVRTPLSAGADHHRAQQLDESGGNQGDHPRGRSGGDGDCQRQDSGGKQTENYVC